MAFEWIKSLFGGKKSSSGKTSGKAVGKGKYTGVIKTVKHNKGFGFIACPEMEKQIFVHFSDASSKLRAGDKVTFNVQETDKGLRAVEVNVVK